MNYLTKPLTKEEIKKMEYWVTGVIPVDLNDLMTFGFENLLDRFSEALIGNYLLMDITYTAKGVTEDGKVLIEVSGEAPDDFE